MRWCMERRTQMTRTNGNGDGATAVHIALQGKCGVGNSLVSAIEPPLGEGQTQPCNGPRTLSGRTAIILTRQNSDGKKQSVGDHLIPFDVSKNLDLVFHSNLLRVGNGREAVKQRRPSRSA